MRHRLVGATAMLALAGFAAMTLPAAAQDATWLAAPGSNDFDSAGNWSPAVVPTAPTGTAFFGTSNRTALSFSTDTMVGGWTFNSGASAYSFTNDQQLQFLGTGIVVNGGSAAITNNFMIQFERASSAGSATITNNPAAFIDFFGTSSAGSATITNNGTITFFGSSTAGNATFLNGQLGSIDFVGGSSTAGSATFNSSGETSFDDATAANATIVNSVAGTVGFLGTGTAANATIFNSGIIDFIQTSTAGRAAISNPGASSFSAIARPATPPSPIAAVSSSFWTTAPPAMPPSPTAQVAASIFRSAAVQPITTAQRWLDRRRWQLLPGRKRAHCRRQQFEHHGDWDHQRLRHRKQLQPARRNRRQPSQDRRRRTDAVGRQHLYRCNHRGCRRAGRERDRVADFSE